MRVLLVARPDAETKPGGDVIQVVNTYKALLGAGVCARLGPANAENVQWSDLVHIFGIQEPEVANRAFALGKRFNKKIVVSPIWWELSHAQMAGQLARMSVPISPFWALARPLAKEAVKILKAGELSSLRRILQEADLLLPNSEEEMLYVRRDFGEKLSPYRVILNAVDTKIFKFSEIGDGVVCFARLEPTKNQMNLIKAVSQIDGLKLTLVGRDGPFPGYADSVRKAADKFGYTVVSHVSQSEMPSIMRRHSIHALPSFRESPGLSSLEALACGLNLVVASPPFCPVETYFGEWLGKRVEICTPYRVDSIKNALVRSIYNVRRDPFELPHRFTWESVGIETKKAYESLL
ncbi:glycosyltransferase family 4 protein [Deinococcus sp. YIM 77859]|uniref:glycosyltransferase family 4 protein n=1 Tax=Deinococcus sp. YIM 77859 TaxID=1540221 RepID=UPI0009DE2DCA|nr:glycosyltransferase family 4 protein [Deinococcus sp. YIM 77859]